MAPDPLSFCDGPGEAFCNSRGFAALPIELLHDIVSYTQGPSIPYRGECAMGSFYRERRNVLLALCQLCRSLRAVFLPLLWERLEACTFSPSAERKWFDKKALALGKELIGQLHLVTNRKKPYASYVRVVNVAIELEFADAVRYLARAMALMPNLHTIQIIWQGCRMKGRPNIIEPDQFRKAFAGHVYPSVRRAVLPVQARGMFPCLPAVADVYLNQPYVFTFAEFASDLALNCHAVESFGWVEHDARVAADAVLKYFPNIRRLECHLTICHEVGFDHLSMLRNLEKLTLTMGYSTDGGATRTIEAARAALAAAPQPNKRLDVIFTNKNVPMTFRWPDQ